MIQRGEAELAALLTQAGDAHFEYETSELNGVYDEDWATWYAGYVVEHGLGDILGREVTSDMAHRLFVDSYEEYKNEGSTEDWAQYTARKILESPV